MPYKNKEQANQYKREWKKRKKLEEGAKKRGRPTLTEEQKIISKQKRSNWEKEWRNEYNQTKPEKRLYWAAKRRAKVKGIPFTILESDIQIPTTCPYLGIKLLPTVPRGKNRDSCMSLDRIDNSKGYEKDNIEVISNLANTMKNSATKEQLKLFALYVLTRNDK